MSLPPSITSTAHCIEAIEKHTATAPLFSSSPRGLSNVGASATVLPDHHSRQGKSCLAQLYPKGTKVVEISNGRRFISRPLDLSLLSPNRQAIIDHGRHPASHNISHLFLQQRARYNPVDTRQPSSLSPHLLYHHDDKSSGFSGNFHNRYSNPLSNYLCQLASSQYNVEGTCQAPFNHSSRFGGSEIFPFDRRGFQHGLLPSDAIALPLSPQTQQVRSRRFEALGIECLTDIRQPLNVNYPMLADPFTSSSFQFKLQTYPPSTTEPFRALPPSIEALFRKSSSTHNLGVKRAKHPIESTSARTNPLIRLFERSSSSVTNDVQVKSPTESNSVLSKHRSSVTTTSLVEMVGGATGTAFSTPQISRTQQRRTAESSRTLCDAKRAGGGGIQWLFDAVNSSTAGTVPESGASPWTVSGSRGSPSLSLTTAFTPQITTPLQPSQQSIEDSWDFNRPEDLIDDEVLFRREELQRRRNPRYLAKTKRLHDLHIVMPICVPYGKIVVDDPLGANFYQFSRKPKNTGAEVLFGKGIVEVGTSGEREESSSIHHDLDSKENKKPSTEHRSKKRRLPGINPVCDVWASFLHVRLGTIYNLTASHMLIITDLFKRSFDNDLCKFYVPISMDCRGVHPSSDELISQRAARPSQLIRDARDGRKSVSERYETHAFPTSENDVKRLRMLRRHIRKFALSLIKDLGFEGERTFRDNESTEHPMQMAMRMANEQPRPCIELHDNCRAETIMYSCLKIVVREWSPLADPDVFKRVWAGQLASPDHSTAHHSGIAAEVRTKLLEHKTIPSARALAGELRLEHNHFRMVDPRWPEELVPGRRVADSCAENEAPGPEETQARFVFCSRVPKPQIIYAYAEKDGSDPRDAALACRLGDLFKVHLARHPTAGINAISHSSNPWRDPPFSASRTPERHTSRGTSPPSTGRSTPEATTSSSSIESQRPHREGSKGDVAEITKRTQEEKPNGSTELAQKTELSQTEQAERARSQLAQDTTEDEPKDEREPDKPITSLLDLKSIPQPFVPVLAESRNPPQYDKSEMPRLLQLMLQQTSQAEKVTSDLSALKSDTAFKVPLSTVACKYFFKGGCARGSECHFLHPADPKLESKVDVRHIVPKHPKFF